MKVEAVQVYRIEQQRLNEWLNGKKQEKSKKIKVKKQETLPALKLRWMNLQVKIKSKETIIVNSAFSSIEIQN